MKILLTGAEGFIGKNIKERLGIRHDIVCWPYTQADLVKTQAVTEILQDGYDAVIHAADNFAAGSQCRIKDNFFNNLLMLASIGKAAANCNVKRIITYGNGSEYDKSLNLCDVTEERLGNVIPQDSAGFCKYTANFLNEAGVRRYNLRCFGLFGKYEDYSSQFISNAICRALCGYSISLKQDRLYSYLFIDDLADITEIFLQNEFKFNDYNITTGEKWSLLDIARLIRRITLKDVPINVALEGKGLEYSASNNRLLKEFFYTFTPMIDAITMLLDWYVLNFDTIDREKLLYGN